ncbi:MAG: hypothetical protein M3463_22045, partial [Verrucomicrobiota bacterium]|nr:hypothetical protein [Verrucomicrobiota bacterium]
MPSSRVFSSAFFTAIFALAFSPAAPVRAADVVDIGDRRELFVDHYLIDRLEDANLVLHHPVDEGPVMRFDKPWEGPFCGYVTVIQDGDLFRLYYRGLPSVDTIERTCYAESTDGIHWTKPELGLHGIEGSKANNVILLPRDPAETGGVKELITHNFSPLLDANPKVDPKRRFKALAGNGLALYALASPDSIHWSRISERPVIEYKDPGVPDLKSQEFATARFAFDSQNLAFWSE